MSVLSPINRRARAVLRRSHSLRSATLAYRHRGLTTDDCFIASFPRSGNTWLRFLLADLAAGGKVDYESVDRLIPGVGRHDGAPLLAGGSRLIKTHERYRQEYQRAVYLVRDVRDVVVSWYRLTRDDRDNFADFDRFVDRFVTGEATPYGKWTDHVASWLQPPPSSAQVLVLLYEELHADTLDALARVTEFVGIKAREDQLQETLARYPVEEMRRLQHVNATYLRHTYGFRTPETSLVAGGWRHKLTDRHLQQLAPALKLQQELIFGRARAPL